jgi:GT2 family glycosyltransferase
VSIVIPSFDASRSTNLKRLVESVRSQSLPPCDIEIVEGVSPNGRARNVGAANTKGEILVFMDDDIQPGAPDILQLFVDFLTSRPDLGMVGTAQQLPPDSSRFQRRCGLQLSRGQSDVVQELTESDMVTTQCCAIRRSVFNEVGGFHDRILRGVDPEMRDRIRKAGYLIAVVPGAWHYHPMPDGWRELLRMAWRDGDASAFARIHFPETVLQNPEGHTAEFDARVSLPRRAARNLLRLIKNLATGRLQGASYGVVYALANVCGSARYRKL